MASTPGAHANCSTKCLTCELNWLIKNMYNK
jgi:hypothetical protein